MTALVVKTFNGLKPISQPRLLEQSDAQTAQNVRLISGSLNPLRNTTTLKSLTVPAPKTIFRYGNSTVESNYWLEFSTDTDVMRSPIAADQYDRLYWSNGSGKPRYAPNSSILSGGGSYPGASFELGIPKPATAITFGAYTAPATYTAVTREYVLSFYDSVTQKESAPTVVFTVQGVDGQKVSFSNLTTNNLGNANITTKRLYRKVSGTFRRVAEIALSTTTFEDTATDASLATAATLPTGFGSVPPAPSRAPTVTAPTVSSTPAAISREYVYTIKNATWVGNGNVSETSPSAPVSISANTTQTVTISGMVNAAGAYSGSYFRVYRKDSGSSQYLFVAEVPTTQTSLTDPIGTTVLGSPLQPEGGTGTPSTPTATASASASVSVVSQIYAMTFVAGADEGPIGPSSTAVNVVDGVTTVAITHSETVPAGVTKKRLYRQRVTVSNGLFTPSDSNWFLVSESTANATTAQDKAAQATLSTPLPSAVQGLPSAPNQTPTLNAFIPAKIVPETRTYVYTYVSRYGEEGPPSDASVLIEVDPAGTVNLTLPSAGPTGSYDITLKRIYRSSAVGSKAQFQYVGEISIATGSYADTTSQANLGEVLPSEGWIGPPSDLKGLRLMANGAAVGFVGKTLYFSEPNLPHAWPHFYTVDDDIIAIGAFGQSVAVLTESFPYLFQGIDPSAMSSTKLRIPQACSSKRSAVETGDGVIYASPDGLVSVGHGGISVITSNIYSRDQWQALAPSSMECFLYNGKVLVFYNTGSVRGMLQFDLSGQGAILTTSNLNTASAVTAGYYDPRTDILYLAQGANIVRHDQGGAMTYIWRSKVFRIPWPENLSFGQLRANAYPVTLRVYADGALKRTQVVTSSNQFRLPSGFRALDWEFEVEGTSEVTEILLTSSSAELRAT